MREEYFETIFELMILAKMKSPVPFVGIGLFAWFMNLESI